MRKIIGIFITLVIVAVMATMAFGENYYDFKESDWIGFSKTEYENAEEKGVYIPEANGYLYEGILYYDTTIFLNMDIEAWGIDEEHYYMLGSKMEEELRETIGIRHGQVHVKRIGKDNNGQWVYDISMITMYNLNDYTNEESDKFGSGFIKKDFEYFGVRCLTHLIPNY